MDHTKSGQPPLRFHFSFIGHAVPNLSNPGLPVYSSRHTRLSIYDVALARELSTEACFSTPHIAMASSSRLFTIPPVFSLLRTTAFTRTWHLAIPHRRTHVTWPCFLSFLHEGLSTTTSRRVVGPEFQYRSSLFKGKTKWDASPGGVDGVWITWSKHVRRDQSTTGVRTTRASPWRRRRGRLGRA